MCLNVRTLNRYVGQTGSAPQAPERTDAASNRRLRIGVEESERAATSRSFSTSIRRQVTPHWKFRRQILTRFLLALRHIVEQDGFTSGDCVRARFRGVDPCVCASDAPESEMRRADVSKIYWHVDAQHPRNHVKVGTARTSNNLNKIL